MIFILNPINDGSKVRQVIDVINGGNLAVLSFPLAIIVPVVLASFYFFFSLKTKKVLINPSLALKLFLLGATSLLYWPVVRITQLGGLAIFRIPFGKIFTTSPWFFQIVPIVILFSFLLLDLFYVLNLKFKTRNYSWMIFFGGLVAYSVLSIQRHMQYGSFTMDLAGYDQAVYLMSRFMAPASSIYHIPNLLGDHFEPLLAIISPVYWLFNDVRAILFLQAIGISLTVFPLYGIAKKYLKSDFAASMIALSFLLFIGVQDAMEFDFHPLTFVPAALAYMFYYLDQKKYGRFFVATIAALLMKEVVAIYVVAFGIFAAVKKHFKVAAVLIILGVIWYLIAIKVIVPHLSHHPYGHIGAYHILGNGPVEIIKTIITRPAFTLSLMLEPGTKITSALAILASAIFLPFFAPAQLILLLPMFGEKFLTSDRESNWVMWWHYTSTVAPVLFIGAIVATKKIIEKYQKQTDILVKIIPMSILLSTMAVSFIFYSKPPFPAPLAKLFTKHFYIRSEHIKKVDAILAGIPGSASVTAADSIAPHLSHRKDIERMQTDVPRLDYIIFDQNLGHWPRSDEEIDNIAEQLRNDPQYDCYYCNEELYVFKKKSL